MTLNEQDSKNQVTVGTSFEFLKVVVLQDRKNSDDISKEEMYDRKDLYYTTYGLI